MAFKRISGLDAYSSVIGNKAASIPKTGQQDNRLESPVFTILNPSYSINKSDSLFTIGSCFARNIENALKEAGLTVPAFTLEIPDSELHKGWVNPRSILNKYTPCSIVNEILGAFGEMDLTKTLLEEPGGEGVLDLQLHSPTAVTKKRAIERREYLNSFNRKAISQADIIVITLGLVEAWYDEESKMYINQAPSYRAVKEHPDRFKFEVLSPEKTISETVRIIDIFQKYGKPGHNVMISVSPVSLGRSFTGNDVLIANNYSKSVLRTAAEVVTRKYDHVDYIPTYENITLSDRKDAWMDDNIHVTPNIVRYNIMKITDAYIEDE